MSSAAIDVAAQGHRAPTSFAAEPGLALGDEGDLEDTLGAALKVHEDVERVRERKVLEGV